jgi:hypothetical protein
MSDHNTHFLLSDSKKKLIPVLTVEYKVLGTIPVDELLQAIYADLQALRDIHQVEFITGARLRLPVTDGYGQPLTVRRANGTPMHQMHTYHYKPACKDYDL